MAPDQPTMPQSALEGAISRQRENLKPWEKRSGAITLEIVRALDDLFCRELFEPIGAVPKTRRLERSIMAWGANQALLRCLPLEDGAVPLRLFPSQEDNQDQVDQFLFLCGNLLFGERLLGWLREGLVRGAFRRHARDGLPELSVLVLKTAEPSLYDEEIGRSGLRWSSDARIRNSRGIEQSLMKQQRAIDLSIERDARLEDGWLPVNSALPEHEAFFYNCGQYYLDRIAGRDLLGPDDRFDGIPFSRYIEVLTALSGRAHHQLSMARALRRRHPEAHLRNLLTAVVPVDQLEGDIARQIGDDPDIIRNILRSLTLSARNLSTHADCEDIAWAPLIQTDAATCIQPLYGLDINPFLFLFRELRATHPRDWFEAANARERRWISELEELFDLENLKTNPKCPKLRSGGRTVTDIDYAVHDRRTNYLTLFQLKWQQPSGVDNRSRRSLAKNLVNECNKWIETVTRYAAEHGALPLLKQLGFEGSEPPRIQLLIVARYNAHFSGYVGRDNRATWTSWDNLRKGLRNTGAGLGPRTISQIQRNEREIRRRHKPESMAFPIGDIAVMLNPTSEPDYDDQD